MSLPYSNNGIAERAGTTAAHANGRLKRRGVHASAIAVALGSVACALLLGACGSAPAKPSNDDRTAVPSAGAEGSSKSGVSTGSSSGAQGDRKSASSAAGSAQPGGAQSPAPAEVPKRAAADFDRAVNLMRAGNATEAELEFKQISVAYPQLASPRINLALLQRKAGRLEEAETTLKAAVEASPNNVVAWNELGVTLRMRGQFKDAVDAYDHAIAADPNFAPAHRNLAIVLDLYLGDAERALTELERYKELTHEEKPVNGWIAELRQRTGKPATPRPAPPPPAEAAPTEGAPAQPADAQPQGAPAAPPPKAGAS